MKALIAINPKSGGGKGASVGAKVRSFFSKSSLEYTIVEGTSRDDSLTQIDALCQTGGFDLLICVGGDGFIHDILPLVMDHKIPLLVIPAGTGNDFARTLGLFGAKLDLLLNLPSVATPKEIDVAMIKHSGGEDPFVQILSTGFDSVVNERANNFKVVKGSVKYVIAVLLEVWRFRAINFEITVDGQRVTQKAMLVCVANGKSYGGGMKVVPQAQNDDGLLNVMVVDRVNPLRLLAVFPRVFFGTHINHPKVHFYSGAKIQIFGETQAFADGEKIGQLPIEISLADRGIKVYTL